MGCRTSGRRSRRSRFGAVCRLQEVDELLADVAPRAGPTEPAQPTAGVRRRAPVCPQPAWPGAADGGLAVALAIFEVLGFLFGISQETAVRTVARVLPTLEAAGLDTMCRPDRGRGHRPHRAALLADTPEVAVIVDSFEQRVRRPQDRAEADTYSSGKKKQHTLKSQVAVDERDGRIVDIPPSVRGPTADLTLLKQSGLLERLPVGVGALGDLSFVGIAALHPPGATPRRKPRRQPRPA